MIATLISLGLLVLLAWLVWELTHAPEGWENGHFHLGSKP